MHPGYIPHLPHPTYVTAYNLKFNKGKQQWEGTQGYKEKILYFCQHVWGGKRPTGLSALAPDPESSSNFAMKLTRQPWTTSLSLPQSISHDVLWLKGGEGVPMYVTLRFWREEWATNMITMIFKPSLTSHAVRRKLACLDIKKAT